MNQSPIKVSVIIPVYNAELYLRQCLDSVMQQSLKEIEIICVNDGSSDHSQEILEEYAKKDHRIKVVVQENKGAAFARNLGLEIAKGEYLSFLDADDYFEHDMLDAIFHKCKKCVADIGIFRCDMYNMELKKNQPMYWTVKGQYLPRKEFFAPEDIKEHIFNFSNGWAWDKLYRREFIIESGILFQNLRTTNDLFFVFASYVKAKRIVFLDRILAHQRTMNCMSLSATREKSWDCFYKALLQLKKFLMENNCYERYEQSYINYALHFSLWNMDTLIGKSNEKLFHLLCEYGFKELGITEHKLKYFYNQDEYKRYDDMMNITYTEYLWEKIINLEKQDKTRSNELYNSTTYKVGSLIMYLPKLLKRKSKKM